MTMTEADIFCPTCQGYVHVFLARCPACGTERPSRIAEARSEPVLGLAALAADPVLCRKLTHLIDGYALTAPRLDLPHKSGFEGKAGPDFPIAEGAGMLVRQLVLRAYGIPPRPSQSAEVRLALTAEDLEAHDGGDNRVAIRVPLAGILSLVAPPRGGLPGWVPINDGGTNVLPTLAIPAGSLLVTYAANGGIGQVSVQNRPGMFSSKARADYYQNLRRWVGLTAAEAAERRWTAIGLARYLAEIGLGPAAAGAAPVTAGAGATATDWTTPATGTAASGDTGPVAPRPSARVALEELEELRSAGLVTDDEYRRKRAEILDRL